MSIKTTLKKLSLKLGLGIVKVFVWLKAALLTLGKPIGRLFVFMWQVVVFLILPLYQLSYSFRRSFEAWYQQAKNRFLFLLANRFTFHVSIALIFFLAFLFNININDVRAETFGEKTIMYELLVTEDIKVIEEEIYIESLVQQGVLRYQPDSGTLTYQPGRTLTGELSPIQVVGGQVDNNAVATSVSPISESSSAPRTEIIEYAVQSGDTLSGIASKFGISLNTLLWANGLSATSSIRPGKELTILPVSGVVHTVRSGDTLLAIANTYDADVDEIVSSNAGVDESLSVGAEILIPGGVKRTTSSSRPVASSPSIATPSSSVSSGSNSSSQQVSATGRMIWPTDLRVITQYYGWSHTGIDIDCHYTNDNYAADSGTVTYSGWRNGYGYTVEIDHGNGLMTRYGHHASLYVRSGQVVSKGDALGRCGTTGRSTGTHLHFEVISGGRFLNPLEYIR